MHNKRGGAQRWLPVGDVVAVELGVTETNSLQQHGSRARRVAQTPRFGLMFDSPLVKICRVARSPYEVNYVSDNDLMTISMGPNTGHRAYNSDKLSPFRAVPGCAYFHPAGVNVYVSETNRLPSRALKHHHGLGELVYEDFAPRRRRLIEDVAENLPGAGLVALAHATSRFLDEGCRGGRMAAESLAILLLVECLGAVFDGRAPHSASGLDKQRLASVLDFIESHLADDIGLTTLARFVGLTPYRFARSFKEAIGLSPRQYILERRVAKVKDLISIGAGSLAEIAYAVGFSSQSHMTEVFRKRLGVTPGQYREQVRR